MTPGEIGWKLAFQQSPIILVGGVADSFLGGYLPIMAITEIINFPAGLLSGGGVGIDNFFANFRPMSGATIIAQDIGKYPFANQTVAANAVIAQPLTISMEMTVIARTRLGYYEKLAIMLALRETLYQHNTSGGRYIVMTPSYIYVNCLMKTMVDVSNAATKQPQNTWQLDFEKPLVTLDEAQASQNNLMQWISRETKMPSVEWSGVDSGVSMPGSLTGTSGVPVAGGSTGGGAVGSTTLGGVGPGPGQVTLPGGLGPGV
jgi:hypothetical protein